jgi:class 3 adenylate cyclase
VGFLFEEKTNVTITEAGAGRQPVPRAVEPSDRCPTCDATVLPGFRFCAQCGRALGATLAPQPGDVVTIAFIDMTGFSAFASRSSGESVREVIRIFHWLVREQLARYGGFEVKQLGDGFMIAFTSPRKAIGCTADVMRVTAPHEDGTGLPAVVRVCAGLNSGDAIREGDDFFGHTVNVASRIVDRARGGEILISEATRDLAGPMDSLEFIDRGRRKLRGIKGRMRLYEVVWDGRR